MFPIPVNSSLNETRREDCICKKHNLPFEFWNNKEKDFFCKRCIFEGNRLTSDLKLLADAVPMVKADIDRMISEANKYLQGDVKEIGNFVSQCTEKLNCVMGYKRKIQELENSLNNLINEGEVLRSNRLKDLALVEKVEAEMEKIETEEHLPLMVSSRAALVSLYHPWRLPGLSALESNLCTIACAFFEGNIEIEFQNSTAFIYEAIKSEDHVPLQPETVNDGELCDGGIWFTDWKNCLAVLQALANRQPRLLVVISRHDTKECLPSKWVAEVAKAAKNCEVYLKLGSSFFMPEDNQMDLELLQYFLDNSSLRLTIFYGYLDVSGLVRLPTTLECLGLSINCALDAITLSSFKPCKSLGWLLVSVSNNVAASDVARLPSVDCISLHFPGLTADRVANVRSSIAALVPDLELYSLVFPLCKLSESGGQYLVQQLHGLRVGMVFFELCGFWQPNKEDRHRIASDLLSIVGCRYVGWDLDGLYTNV